ncbi:MAG: SDR family NAD(P)-dependent oxidoreductase [Clostridia bacterium]|nr:SDR family NAD(P)-dependent oxidoreductase [Clostridia bacterium]
MNYERWLKKNAGTLSGKRVAITGATGGIGMELCRHVAHLDAELVLLNRSREKTEELIVRLKSEFPNLLVSFIPLDLTDMQSVDAAVECLKADCPDLLIHNAGAYSIPRYKTSLLVDNVFQINCLAPFYMTERLIEPLRQRQGRVVIVGSIAHTYSKTDAADFDFATRRAASRVYGNAKRTLMLAMYERFQTETAVSLSVVHPGITLTNITAHYPKFVFALIKHPMKVLFMSPKKAALCVVQGVFTPCRYGEWIGPRVAGIWGLPRKTVLHTFDREEAARAYETLLSVLP